MRKATAAILLIADAKSKRHSLTSARRIAQACETLGLSNEDTKEVFGFLDYGGKEGCGPEVVERITKDVPDAHRRRRIA